MRKNFVGSLNLMFSLSPFVGMSIQRERDKQKSTKVDPNPLFHSIWINKPPVLSPRYVVVSSFHFTKMPLIICSDMVSFVSPRCLLVTFSHFAEIPVVIRTDMLPFISLG